MIQHIHKIEVDHDVQGNILDVSFFFIGSNEPFSISEFKLDSTSRMLLMRIWNAIELFEENCAVKKEEQE